jgi:hypothetical protein
VLNFIPAWWTDELQPLDQDILSRLKAICRRLFACHDDTAQDVVETDAIRFVFEAWDVLNVVVVEKGCGRYEDKVADRADGDKEETPAWDEQQTSCLVDSGRKNMETIRLFIQIANVTHDENRD